MLGLGLIQLKSRQLFSNLDVWMVWKLEGMGGGGESVLEITKERPLRKSSLGIAKPSLALKSEIEPSFLPFL